MSLVYDPVCSLSDCSVKNNKSLQPTPADPITPTTSFSHTASSATHSLTSTPLSSSNTSALASISQRSHTHDTPNNLHPNDYLSQTISSQHSQVSNTGKKDQ